MLKVALAVTWILVGKTLGQSAVYYPGVDPRKSVKADLGSRASKGSPNP